MGCNKKPLSKRDITQNFKRHATNLRLESIETLLKHQLIEKKEMPKPDTRRVPTYYFITNEGTLWLNQYLSALA